MTKGRPPKDVIENLGRVGQRTGKEECPCAIFILHLLGEARLMASTSFHSCSCYPRRCFFFCQQFDYGLRATSLNFTYQGVRSIMSGMNMTALTGRFSLEA